MKKRTLIQLIAVVLLANFTLANFAFAASFTATPSTVVSGQPVTLKWEGYNSRTGVTIEPGIGSKSSTGEVVVNPTTTTKYTLTSANFANAEVTVTVGTATNKNVKLTPESLNKAQINPTECQQFSKDVSYVTNTQAKAIWYERAAYRNQAAIKGCFIVPPDHEDKGLVSASRLNQPEAFKNFQTTILNGSGIDSNTVTKAQKESVDNAAEANIFSKVFGYALTYIFDLLSAVGMGIAALAARVFSYFLDIAVNVTEMPRIVDVGWTIIRDFANMFFILILIAIALAAILRIESYDYRHLLGEVIIMALLVNFSKVIAVTLINFTNFLIASIAGDIGFRLVAGHMFTFLLDSGQNLVTTGGWSSAAAAGIGKLVFVYAAVIAFLAIAGLFVVRQIGLYILVIFSPMAYVLDILPATKNLAHNWWHKFIEYLIWGPVAVFMIKLSFLIMDQENFAGAGDTSSAFTFIILAAFLFGAVFIAHHAGMVGGDAVINGVEGLGHQVQHMAGGYAGRKWNEWTTQRFLESHDGKERSVLSRATFAVLNPVAAFKGAQQRSHELSHMAQEEAVAGGREVMEQVFTTRPKIFGGTGKAKLKIPYRQFVARKDEDKFLKDYGQMKKESLMRAAVDAEGMKGFEGEARKRAIVKAAASNGYLDDLMRMKSFAEKYTGNDDVVYGTESLNRFLYGYLGRGEQSMRFMAEDMEEMGKKTKHYEYMGHAFYNNDTKQWERGMEVDGTEEVTRGSNKIRVEKFKPLTKDTWQVKYSVGEFSKLGGRDRIGAAPHNFTTIRAETNTDGTFKDTGDELDKGLTFGRKDGQFDAFNEEMLKRMDSDVMREVQHAQARVKTWLMADSFEPGTGGRIKLDDMEHYQELERLYQINPEFVKGLYTKVLKVKGDARESIDGIRVQWNDPVTNDPVYRDLGRPTFVYTENPPAVKKPGAPATPPTPTP